jgi:hypothetical protein
MYVLQDTWLPIDTVCITMYTVNAYVEYMRFWCSHTTWLLIGSYVRRQEQESFRSAAPAAHAHTPGTHEKLGRTSYAVDSSNGIESTTMVLSYESIFTSRFCHYYRPHFGEIYGT